MRYGCSVRTVEQAKHVIDSDYDYIEMNLCSLASMTGDEFSRFQRQIADCPKKIEVFNLLLPLSNEIKIVGDDVDINLQNEYIRVSFERAYNMGAEIMVFGSARARAVPVNYSETKAYAQLADFLIRMLESADKYNLTIVIEPVCTKEVPRNQIQTIADAIKLAEFVGHESLYVLCDLFHMYHENDPMESIVEAGDWIKHAHLSGIDDGRKYPAVDDGFDYGPYFESLKAIKYAGRISLECFDQNIERGLITSLEIFDKYR